jgi:hypothetical protein
MIWKNLINVLFLVGLLHVDKWKRLKMQQVEKALPFVSKGGSWKPTKCLATKVGIIYWGICRIAVFQAHNATPTS